MNSPFPSNIFSNLFGETVLQTDRKACRSHFDPRQINKYNSSIEGRWNLPAYASINCDPLGKCTQKRYARLTEWQLGTVLQSKGSNSWKRRQDNLYPQQQDRCGLSVYLYMSQTCDQFSHYPVSRVIFNRGMCEHMSCHTMRYQQVAQDADPGNDEAATLRWAPSGKTHRHGYDNLSGDVDRPEDHLNQVDVHTKFLQIHGQAVVGEARR